MDLYYNLTRQCRVNESNCVLSGRPVLYLGAKPELTLHFFHGEPGTDPTAADLSGAVTWRAAVDADWTGSTDPMCRTLSEDIDAASAATGVIKLPINTCTTRFAEALGNRQSIEAYFELRGFDSSGAAAVVVIFPVLCHNAVDVDGGAALDDVPSDVPTKSWIIAVLSGYTAATASINDLTIRVGGAESAIEGATASIAGLTTSVSALADDVAELEPVTAFEVYAHDEDIPAGEYCAALCKTGDVVFQTIPACMGEHLVIGTSQSGSGQDVVIEWGDGSTERLADVPAAHICGVRRHLFHLYSAPGKYIVRIVGTTYAYFRPGVVESADGILQEGYGNLTCRIFDYDLPVASHISNFSGCCASSPRLLYVNVASCKAFKFQAQHCDTLFQGSTNLLEAVGFDKRCNRVTATSNCFNGCTALRSTDFVLPTVMVGDGPNRFCDDCGNLVADIASFFPAGFTPGVTPRAGNLFRNCAKLTGTVPADKLWDSPYPWTNTGNAFKGCSDAIRAQVPVSWGGTASDDIIKPKLTGLDILHPVAVTGGTVKLTASRNAYTVAPTSATSITIDAAGLGEVAGAVFTLIVDMSAGVQSVSFPENFSFVGGTAPVMSKKGYYFIRTTYSGLGEGGFFGECIGVTQPPKDMTRGVWFWVDGELDTSTYEGQDYFASADFSGGTMRIQPGAIVGSLYADEAYDEENWTGKNALCIIAGTVGSLFITDAGDGIGGHDLRAVVDGGTVGTASLGGSACFLSLHVDDGLVVQATLSTQLASVSVAGGTVGSIDFRGGTVFLSDGVVGGISCYYAAGEQCNTIVSGGVVTGTIDRDCSSYLNNLSVTGGTVNAISTTMSLNGDLSVTGGTVASITQTAIDGMVAVGGTALVGLVTLGDELDYVGVGSGLTVSGNALVLRVEDRYMIDEEDPGAVVKTGITVSGGTVGIARSLAAKITAGWVALNVTGGTVVYLDN